MGLRQSDVMDSLADRAMQMKRPSGQFVGERAARQLVLRAMTCPAVIEEVMAQVEFLLEEDAKERL